MLKLPIQIAVLLLLSVVCAFAGSVKDYSAKIAPLIDPAKLAVLKERGANPRVQKYTHWLAAARIDKIDPNKVVDAAIHQATPKPSN